jgi:hypothetical protein
LHEQQSSSSESETEVGGSATDRVSDLIRHAIWHGQRNGPPAVTDMIIARSVAAVRMTLRPDKSATLSQSSALQSTAMKENTAQTNISSPRRS